MKTPGPWLVASVTFGGAFAVAAGADRIDARVAVALLFAGVALAVAGAARALRQRRARIAAACLAIGWLAVAGWLGSRSVRSAGLAALRRIAAVNTEP